MALSISLANLLFLNSWITIEKLHVPGLDYYRQSYTYVPEFALLLSVAVLTACLLTSSVLIGGSSRRWVHSTGRFFFVSLAGLAAAKMVWNLAIRERHLAHVAILFLQVPGKTEANLGPQGSLSLAAIMIGVTCAALVKYRDAAYRGAAIFVLIWTPLAGIHLLELGWYASIRPSRLAFAEKATAPGLGAGLTGRRSRLLWLVFDEMDQRLAFEQRPAYLHLPELDRLRGESISDSEAFSTRDRTLEAMPSLIVGKEVTTSEPLGPDDILLTFAGGQQSRWSVAPNLFADARSLGLNTAIIGWLQPYCRVLSRSLVSCSEFECQQATPALMRQTYFQHLGIVKSAVALSEAEFGLGSRYLRFDGRSYPEIEWSELQLIRRLQGQSFLALHRRGVRDAIDPQLDFTLIHYPVPHPLGIFDRAGKHQSTDPRANYLDNLALVDWVIAELRAELEKAGLWDSTTIVLTADHPIRQFWSELPTWTPEMAALSIDWSKPRPVPLLVRLPLQRKPFAIASHVDNVGVHDLLLALMRRELTSPDEVVRWLMAHDTSNGPQRPR